VVVGSDQSGGNPSRQQPPLRIVAIYAEWAGKDVLLVEQDVEEKLSRERFEALSIAWVENAVSPVEPSRFCLRIWCSGGFCGLLFTRRFRSLTCGLRTKRSIF